MVGRPVNSTAVYKSLLFSLKAIPSGYIIINPPSSTCTYTTYISIIPHMYLHSLHLITPPHAPTQTKFQCTYTAYISLIPHIHLHSLHSLHLITPLHIPTQPTSDYSPTCTYTTYISSIPHKHLHRLCSG